MNEFDEVDLHRFELRFKQTRIIRTRYRMQLLQSISMDGLRSPVEAVPEADRFILVDGYLRFDIMRDLGRDTIAVRIRPGTVPEAVLHYLRAGQAKSIDAIEEGWLIDHLINKALSYAEIGRRIGKNKSWAQRRHRLVLDLPEPLQEAVRQSQISSWSAARVFTPLSRANAQHAEQLLQAQCASPLSSRELMTWFKHYQQSNQGQRAALVEQPNVLLKMLQQQKNTAQTELLQKGVDGRWLEQIQRMTHQVRQLSQSVTAVLGPSQSPAQRALLLDAYADLAQQFQQFTQRINEVTHAGPAHPRGHQATASEGRLNSTNQSVNETIEKHGQARPEKSQEGKKASPEVAERYLHAARALLQDEGQCR